MQAARRLYLYAMSGITLGVIAFGLILLLRVLLRGVFPDPYAADYGGDYEAYDNSREQLSQAIAMLAVAAPVWAVHWWLVQRGLREGRPERDEERGSSLRAIYVTGILLISLLVWVLSAVSLLQWLVTDLLNVVPEYSYQDPLGSATAVVPAFAIWLYHGLVRRRDLAAGSVSGAAAWVPRLYLYGVTVLSVYIVLTVVGSILNTVTWSDHLGAADDYQTIEVIGQVITAIAWALVWLGHSTYAGRLARDPSWRGTEERVSRFRVGALVSIIVVAAASALINLDIALGAAIEPFLPPQPGFTTTLDARLLASPLIVAALWAAVWWWHSRVLRREPAATDPLRALHQERLVSHGIAGAALAIGATGAGWLIGFLFDLVVGQPHLEYPSSELARFLPLAILGLGTWAWWWRRVVVRRRADPAGEAGSTIRRAFLYLTLGVALVVAIGAAAVILYRVVGFVIGTADDGNLVELATPLGTLIAAAIVLAYHGLALRADQRLLATAAAASAAPEAVAAEAASVEPQEERRVLALTGPSGADLDGALAAARAALPEGIELVNAED